MVNPRRAYVSPKIKKWNQLGVKQYDTTNIFEDLVITPKKMHLEELPKKKFTLISKIKKDRNLQYVPSDEHKLMKEKK